MRVNARFDDDLARRLEYLTRVTNLGVSDVIKSSVMMFYESVRGQAAPQLHALGPLIGQFGSGRSDVSATYKTLLADSWLAKHGKPVVKPTVLREPTSPTVQQTAAADEGAPALRPLLSSAPLKPLKPLRSTPLKSPKSDTAP
jgi:hypothetical protein